MVDQGVARAHRALVQGLLERIERQVGTQRVRHPSAHDTSRVAKQPDFATVRIGLNLMREQLAEAGEGEAPAEEARRHADDPAQPLFLVDRCRVRDQRARLRLDCHCAHHVAQPHTDLDPCARLGVAAVVAKPHLSARGERRVVADFGLLDDTIQSDN